MKNLFYLFLAAVFIAGSYYIFTPSADKSQRAELSSQAEVAANKEAEESHEIDYENLPANEKALLDREDGQDEVRAAEMEYAIEQAPPNSDGFSITTEFKDESEDLMTQALNF